MLALLRTRRWIGFTTLVIVLIAAFGVLSHWQWLRADEKRAQRLIVERSTADQPPTSVAQSNAGDIDEWELVSATGLFDASRQVVVRQRPQNGGNGYWVLTPLIDGSGREIWVNRGWLAATGPAITTPESPLPPSVTTTVTGWWRLPETVSEASRSGLPEGMVGAVDPSVLPDTISMPGYVQLVSSSPEGLGLLPVPRPTIDEGQNISYAVQWILFAVVGVIGWFIFLRRESLEDAERATTLAAAASHDGRAA